MKTLAYYNGAIGSVEEMTVPFCDRVCFFGDGVYDATYARNGKIFSLDEHLDRLYRSARIVSLPPPIAPDDLTRLVRLLVTRCDEREVFVYVQFTRGVCIPRNHLPSGNANLWITVTPKAVTPREKRYRLARVEDERYTFCYAKTLNLLPNVLAATYAAENECDEAVFCENGIVNECAHSNVHILSENVLFSPPAGKKVLGGIARKHLLSACAALGIDVCERHFSVNELLRADEVFVTSAGTFLTPCASFDGAPVGGRAPETVRALQDRLYGAFYAATE